MITRLLEILRLNALTGDKNGWPETPGPVETLKASYHDLSRLAEQIHSHAEKARYPHVAERLRQIAAEKRTAANTLKVKILSLGGALEAPQFDLRSGQNHWERMVRDLEDQRTLETSCLARAARLAEEAPELSDLLKKIVAEQAPHKEILLDLVARADPQADQS